MSVPSLNQINPLKVEAELLKRSFYEFYKGAFAVLESGTEYIDGFFIKYLCDTLQDIAEGVIRKEPKQGDLIINCPPRSSKSLIASVAFPIWCWAKNPSMKFVTASYSSSLSLDLAVKSRDLLNSQWFKDRFDITIKEDENTKGSIANTSGGRRVSTSVGGSLTGKGCDIMILDDPQNAQTSSSDVENKNTIDWYKGTAYNRLDNSKVGVRIIIQQRLGTDDLTGYLLKNNKKYYRHICLPVELSDSVSPASLKKEYVNGLLWPERFDREVLDEYKAALGTKNYAGQYNQVPSPPEGLLFKKVWFNLIKEFEFKALTKGQALTWNFIIDSAETEKKENDATGICVYTHYENNLYIRHYVAVRKEFTALLKHLKDLIPQYYSEGSRVYIEGKSSGKSLISQLKKDTTLSIVEIQPGKESKYQRAESQTPFVESKRVFLFDSHWTENFLEEVCQFPAGKHDESVDCLVYAIKKIKKNNFHWAIIN